MARRIKNLQDLEQWTFWLRVLARSLPGSVGGLIGGGVLGLFAGVLLGVLVALFTASNFLPLKNLKRYQSVVLIIGGVFGALVGIGFLSIAQNLIEILTGDESSPYALKQLAAAFVGAAGYIVAANGIGQWCIKTLARLGLVGEGEVEKRVWWRPAALVAGVAVLGYLITAGLITNAGFQFTIARYAVQLNVQTPTQSTSQPAAKAQDPYTLLQQSANWHIVLSDSFDQVANDWTVDRYSTDDFSVNKSIANGKYTWELKALHPSSNLDIPHMASAVNYVVSIEGRRVSGTPTNYYGLFLRRDPLSYYVFEIRDDGSYRFGRAIDNQISNIASGTSSAIKADAANRLTVLAQETHFTLFVNDQYVTSADAGLNAGTAGPIVELLHVGDEGVFEFDNFIVRAPLYRPVG